MVVNIENEGQLLAILIKASYKQEGIHFFTSGDFSQQLGYMNRPKGYQIPPHVHNPVTREIIWTQEVLFIKSGRVRVDFYTDDRKYIDSRVLEQGDVILLATGGHGFEMIEESEIIEVKQGPYCGDEDKTRFDMVENSLINIK